jgi:hypothetical protein
VILLASSAFAASVAGTVSGPDGEPVPGADVVAYDTRLNYAAATTTGTGGFRITGLPPGRYRLRAMPDDGDPRVDRFLPDTWDFCEAEVVEVAGGDDIDGLDFALPLGGELSGRLLGTDGAPVEGAQLLGMGQSERTSLVSRLAETDADGRFTVVGLDSEPGVSEPYAVYLAAAGVPRQYLGPTYDDDSAALFDVTLGDPTDAGEHTLLDGITASGTVYGPDGPVSSGTVFAYSSSQVLTVPVGADGTWLADGLPPGDLVAWSSSDGLATTYFPDSDRPGERVPAPNEGQVLTGVDLDLPLESSLTVTLTGEGDLSDASALLYNDTYTVGRGGGFDADGTVVIDALYPGTYYLFVYGGDVGYTDDFVRDDAGALVPIVVDGATAVTVEMPTAASFAGTVRGDDGEPVYGAYVYATSADGENTEVGVTDADGVYTIPALPGGEYQLRASYAHYCPSDPGWVTMWFSDALVEDDARPTTLASGEARTGVDFTLPRDDDHDGMGDSWEAANGLDPNRDDAAEDPDGDGYLNAEEWLLGTDPTDEAVATGCGHGGCGKPAGLGFFLLPALVYRRRRSAACTGTPRSRALR